MKLNRLAALLLVTISAFSCVSEKDYEDSKSRIEANEKQIATVNEQITAINSSISSLDATDKQLKEYIQSLQSEAEGLQAAIEANAKEMESANQDLLEKLKALEEELNKKLATVNLALADLQAKDAELESKIASLKEYVDKELKNAKDWASATFSTIEQYYSTVTIIAGIKADIEAVNKAIEDLESKFNTKIDEAIAKLESSLKSWVNAQLTAYYTITQIDAKLALIQKSITDGDAALMEEVKTLQQKLADQKAEITEAYKKAITEAITTNNGIIEGKIQTAVSEINTRITEEVASINLKITQINNRLNGIDEQIATINEQITAINSSITQLESTDGELKEYIKALQTKTGELQAAVEANAKEIKSVEAELKEAINSAKLEQLEKLKALEEELNKKLATVNLSLADLQAKDAELESKIVSIKEYVDKELKNAKDWATATFSTIEQYNTTVTTIAGIKADIESINLAIENLETSLTSKINDAITALENSLKSWVNCQLTAYYTIAQIDAKVSLLEKAIADGDEATMAEINALKTKLSEQKDEITEAYKAAISEAITNNNGVIEGKIQTAVDNVNSRITEEVATINQKIVGINNRLNGIEESIAEILGMIQSIVVVPSYSDGEVALGEDETSLYFEVFPLEAAKKLESVELTAFSLKAVSSIQTKADVEYKTLPIKAVKYEDDLVKVTTSGKDISQDFFNGVLSLNARLSITDGLNSLSSSYFGLRPQGDVNLTALRIAEYKKKVIDRIMTIGETGNIIIRFVDGSSVELKQHSASPRLYLDYDGYWSVSYDNGEHTYRTVDSNDDDIKVDDLQSDDILCVRLTQGLNGKYRQQLFKSSQPDVIIDEVNTSVTVDKDNSILSIADNNVNNLVTVTAANGQSFSFTKARIVPTGISILANKVYQSEKNTVSVEFRVNPSNASFNYDVTSSSCELELDYVGNSTKSSYVTAPTNYKLTSVEQVYDGLGAKKEGQYKAYITDAGKDSSYDELAALVLTINDGIGQTIQLSSPPVEIKYSGNLITKFSFLKADNACVSDDVDAVIYGNSIVVNSANIKDRNNLIARFSSNGIKVFVGEEEQTSGITTNDFATPVKYTVVSVDGEKKEYNVIVNNSGIPVVNIITPNEQAVTSKEEWINETSIAIVNADGELFGSSGKIKGRGNATWTYPKKPYAIKYDKKQSPFGFPENKSWVLLAEYCDRSLLRTAYMCAISKAAEIEYTINYKHIDLYLNGKYQGIYLFTDKVEDGKNRINVKKDGFIIEDDSYYYNENLYFITDYLHGGFSFKYPDDDGDIVEGDENYTYIKQYMNNLEQALIVLDTNPTDETYLDYIDIKSFAKYYVASELFGTYDPNKYYVLSSKTSKLKMMPMWDAEWSLGLWPNAWGSAPSDMITDVFWEKRYYFRFLFKSSVFRNEVVSEWKILKNNIDNINQEIGSIESILSGAAYNNFNMWKSSMVQPLNVSFDKWEDEVSYINSFFNDRAIWLDSHISIWN